MLTLSQSQNLTLWLEAGQVKDGEGKTKFRQGRTNLGSGSSPGKGAWQPTPVITCLENPMDRALWATIRGVAKSDMTRRFSSMHE